MLLDVGEIRPTATIDGKGNCSVTGSSPRLYITVDNKNVKFSAEVFVVKSVREIYLVARSNHEIDEPPGFGGYYYYLNFENKEAYFKKEQTHKIGYSSRLDSHPIDFQPGKWYLAEIYVLNDGKNVKLEGYFDGFPINDFLDDGKIKCGDQENTPPYIDAGKWCFLRTNRPDDVRYRNVKVEPIRDIIDVISE